MGDPKPLSLFLVALFLVAALVLSAAPAFPDKKKRPGSPIRDAKKLAKRQAVAEKKLVKEHVAAAKAHEKAKGEWELWFELKLALQIDPKHKRAMRLLPGVQPALPEVVQPTFQEARSRLKALAREQFGGVLDRGLRGKLPSAVLAPLAQILLRYDADFEPARSVLGFKGKRGAWLQPKELAALARYRKAFAKVPSPKILEASPYPKLGAALGKKLVVVRGPHCFAAGIKGSVKEGDLITIVKAAEVAYAAMHAEFLGQPNSVFGGKRQATGSKLKAWRAPLYLVLPGKAAHQRYLDRVVSNPELKLVGRSLTFVSTWWKPEKVLICNNKAQGKYLREWPAQQMATQVIVQRFGPNRPTYLVQGLTRYYSAHVSRQARIRAVPLGSKSRDAKRMRAGDYAQLRSLARWAQDNFRVDPPARLGLYKTLNAMNRADNAVATAFVDFLLSKRRGALIKLLQVGNGKTGAVEVAYAEAFGEETTEALDQAFSAWFCANY